jgi:hypothetical protein
MGQGSVLFPFVRRILGLGPVLLLAFAVVASASVGLHLSDDPSARDDLAFVGPEGSLWAAGGMHKGDILGFALPGMQNTSDRPLQIVGFRLDQVPAGTRLVGFRLLSIFDTDGILLGSFPTNTPGRNGYDSYPDYLPKHPIIGPRQVSSLYPVVYLELLTPTTDVASGCEYLYSDGGVQHEQRAPCELHMQPPETSAGAASDQSAFTSADGSLAWSLRHPLIGMTVRPQYDHSCR